MSRLTSTTHRNAYTSNPSTSTTPRPSSSNSNYASGPVLLPNAHASGSLSGGNGSSRQNLYGHPYSAPGSGRGTPTPIPNQGSSSNAYAESPYGSSAGGGGAYSHSRSAHEVERQNDEKLEGLLGRVKLLKDITVGIGDEVRQSNMELGSMTDAFTSTSTLLGGTFKRMNKMAKKQGGNWCWFMLFLILVLWIFIVVWFKRKTVG